MNLKLAGIALKRPQNGTQIKTTHRRVEVVSIQFLSHISHTIGTFPYKFLYITLLGHVL